MVTVGAKLAPALLLSFLKHRYPVVSVSDWIGQSEEIDHKGESKPVTWRYIDLTGKAPEIPARISVRPYGSGTGFESLSQGKVDIAMSSRPIKASEVLRLAEYGDLTNPESEHVIALDGVAVIVHPDNPIETLTMDQLAAIFACEITDWKAVGGAPDPIRIYARDANSGTYDTFKSAVLKAKGKQLCPAAERYYSNHELSGNVRTNPQAIGFVGLAYIGAAKALSLADCGLAYRPTSYSVKTEEYPISRRLFMYIPKQSKTPFSSAFLTFIQSDRAKPPHSPLAPWTWVSRQAKSCEAKGHHLTQICRAMLTAQYLPTLKNYL